MTFASEAVRMLFHQLPTQTQVEYTALENRCADNGQRLHIDDVIVQVDCLEVVIRITQDIKPVALGLSYRAVSD